MTKVEQIKSLSIAAVFLLGVVHLGAGNLHTQGADEPEIEDYQDEDDVLGSEEIMEEIDEMEEDFLTEDLLPVWTAPSQYRVEIRLAWGTQFVTVRRFVSANRIRSEVLGENRETVWLESGDAQGSLYQLLESESLAIVQTPGDPAYAFGSRQLGAGSESYVVEYLGEDVISGRRALEYQVATSEGALFAWFDVYTGAPLRMETEREGVPFVIAWERLLIKTQPDDLFAVPEGFTVRQREIRAALESNRTDRAIVGQLSDEEVARIDGGAGDPEWNVVFHSPVGDTAQAHGHPFGGLLGSVAGSYVPGWLGAVLGGRAGSQT